MRKIFGFLCAIIPLIVYFGAPYVATHLYDHALARVILAVTWGSCIYLYIITDKTQRELKRTKHILFERERAYHNETKRLEIVMDLLTDEQLLQFCQKDIRGHAPIKYEYFNPHSEDGKYEWVDYD